MTPINTKNGKSQTIKAQYQNSYISSFVIYHGTYGASGVAERITDEMNEKPVYEVKNGLITIKGKQYPIKLEDGYYNIRKLTVEECMRLQTVPEWFEFPVSNSQAYRQLGNGWTCSVIEHLIKCCLKGELEHEQMKLF